MAIEAWDMVHTMLYHDELSILMPRLIAGYTLEYSVMYVYVKSILLESSYSYCIAMIGLQLAHGGHACAAPPACFARFCVLFVGEDKGRGRQAAYLSRLLPRL